MLELDIQQILSQAIAFVILWWLLKRTAWGPLLSLIDERRERIEGDLKRAEAVRVEVESVRGELNKRLAAIDDEGRARIQEAVREGRKVAAEIQDEARTQAHELLQKAKEAVDLEVDKARVTLRNELVDLVVDAAEQVLRRKLDAQADAKLVEAVLQDLEQRDARAAGQ